MFNLKDGIRMIASGFDFCLALTTRGVVLSWGEKSPALGLGPLDQRQLVPSQVYLKVGRNNYLAKYIAAGSNFAAAITTDNNLYMWGDNKFGQLGIKHSRTGEENFPVNLDHQCIMVACGLYHTCSIKPELSVYSWGNNRQGQLGHSPKESLVNIPTEVEGLMGRCCTYISCGIDNSMAFNDVGEAFGWGNNAYYKMGPEISPLKCDLIPTGKNYNFPNQFDIDFSEHGKPNERVRTIKLEKKYSLIVTNYQRLYYMGCLPSHEKDLDFKDPLVPFEKELGIHILRIDELKKPGNPEFIFPKDDPREKGGEFETNNFSLEIRNGKEVFLNLGLNENSNKDDAEEIFKQVEAGDNFSVALTSFGELMVWGTNDSGQLGSSKEAVKVAYQEILTQGTVKKANRYYPIGCFPHFLNFFKLEKNRKVTKFCCGAHHVIAIENGRAVYSWGSNSHGQLGLGIPQGKNIMTPNKIINLSGMELEDCSASVDYSLVLSTSGNLYSAGSNSYGKLGQNNFNLEKCSLKFEKLEHINAVIKVCAGPTHALAICMVKGVEANIFDDLAGKQVQDEKPLDSVKDTQKVLYSWGSNLFKQLGIKGQPDLKISPSPLKLELIKNFSEISAGPFHSAAVVHGGAELYVWGRANRILQKKSADGVSGEENRLLALLYEEPTLCDFRNQQRISSIKLGETIDIALTTESTMYYWGSFDSPANADPSKKIKVDGDGKGAQEESVAISQVDTSHYHSIGLSKDKRTVFCWGTDNFTGRLGLSVIKADKRRESRKKGDDKKSQITEGFQSPTDIVAHPLEVEVVPTLISQRKTEIILSGNPRKFDKDAEKENASISKSNIITELTQDTSMNDTYSTQIESKASSKIKWYQLLSEEYLTFLQGRADHARLNLLRALDRLNEELVKRDLEVERLKMSMVSRLKEEPFMMTFSNPVEIPMDAVLDSEACYMRIRHTLTALQLHPCLLVKLVEDSIKKGTNDISPEDFAEFVWQLYGALKYNTRKEDLYLTLMEEVLALEIDNLKEANHIEFYRFGQEGNSTSLHSGSSSQVTTIRYTAELVNVVIRHSVERSKILDVVYNKLKKSIFDKTKSMEKSKKSTAYVILDSGSSSVDKSLTQVDDMIERVTSLDKIILQDNNIFDDLLKDKETSFVARILGKINEVLSDLKNYKDKDVVRMLWVYLILPLKSKIETELTKIESNDEREILEKNLQNIFFYTIHFATGMVPTIRADKGNKEGDAWQAKLADYIKGPGSAIPKEKLKEIQNTHSSENQINKFFDDVDNFTLQTGFLNSDEALKNDDKDDDTMSVRGHNNLEKPNLKQRLDFKNLILYTLQVRELQEEKVSIRKNILHNVLSIIISDGFEQKADFYKDFKESFQRDEKEEFIDCLSELGLSDDGFVNFLLLNKDYVLTNSIELKKCLQCECFCPSLLIDSNQVQPLTFPFITEKKGSDLYYFVKVVQNLNKEDRMKQIQSQRREDQKEMSSTTEKSKFVRELWYNHTALKEECLNQKIKESSNLETKKALGSMMKAIEKKLMEAKVNVDGDDVLEGGNDDDDSFLKIHHISLVNQIKDQISRRQSFANYMKFLRQYIEEYIIPIIQEIIGQIKLSMKKSNVIIQGKKEYCLFESLYFNFKLGFANWSEVEAYEKENRFVKLLRQSVYKQGVSQLIFQDLTKQEKCYIESKVVVPSKKIGNLIYTVNYREQLRRHLYLECSFSSKDLVFRMDFYIAEKHVSGQENHLFEQLKLTEEEVYVIRFKNYLKKEREIQNKTGGNSTSTKVPQENLILPNSKIKFKLNPLLELLEQVQKKAYIYQLIDYLEDSTK